MHFQNSYFTEAPSPGHTGLFPPTLERRRHGTRQLPVSRSGPTDQWAQIQAWLPRFLLCHFGQHVTSLSCVFLVANMEMLGPILYSSWNSFVRCCFRRTQLRPGTYRGLSRCQPHENHTPVLLLLVWVLLEDKIVRFFKLWYNLHKMHTSCTAQFLQMYTPT